MPTDRSDTDAPRLGRRHYLAALGGVTTAALAGCEALSSVTNQSFEAASVGLSADGQERLQLSELASESVSFEKSAADGNVSVSVTTHTAVYSRAPALGGL